MATTDLIAFVGASARLADELLKLQGRLIAAQVVAPSMDAKSVGVNQRSIAKALSGIKAASLRRQANNAVRLTLWAYESLAMEEFNHLMIALGRAAWVELVPGSLKTDAAGTRVYIEQRITAVRSLLHLISHETDGGRRSSPIPLPLINFESDITEQLRALWYRGLPEAELKDQIARFRRRLHSRRSEGSYSDDRNLLFEPAEHGVSHGEARPGGASAENYLAGTFRFGTALYPGFHYEVRERAGTLRKSLYDCDRGMIDMGPSRRDYVNIYPNDFLLPK